MIARRIVSLNGLEIPARIGIYPHEQEQDHLFMVDIDLGMDAPVEEQAVALVSTIDYETALEIVRDVMREPEQLLETVANRIALRCREKFPQLRSIRLSIHKKNPPLQAKADSSSVTLQIEFP